MEQRPGPGREGNEKYDEYGSAYPPGSEDYRGRNGNYGPDAPETPEWLREGAAYGAPPDSSSTPEERARSRSRAVTGRLIFVLAVTVLIIILLQGVVFRLTTVYVIGNVTKTPQEVAAASGLVKGLNMFSISEDEVRENLGSDHTIVFEKMQKDYPSTIYLYISERESVASIQWLGLLYTLDDEGMVMDEANSTELPKGMPSVTGLQVTSIHVGQPLEVRNQKQMQAYFDIVSELKLQYYLDQITEINLSDTDNLYLQTANGISVRLGTGEYIRAKIGAIRTDIPYLEQLGKNSGVLDVSTPEDAKYSPGS
jgi:cell division septal protein FtsQ